MEALAQIINESEGKYILQTYISFIELKDLARFSYREEEREGEQDSDYKYQRKTDENHLRGIKQYIIQSISDIRTMPLFPTPLLLACNYENSLDATKGLVEFSLPEYFYIIDGQHRLRAMKEVYEQATETEDKAQLDYLKKFKFMCLVYLNFDIYEQARIFADVNFKQKKVNKSLYYDIYGSSYREENGDDALNILATSHRLVNDLNTDGKSPLKDTIKMLGYGKYKSVSQAFLVEEFISSLSRPSGIWYQGVDALIDLKTYSRIKAETFGYFCAVEECLSEQWNSEDSIIRKTTAMSALIKLMNYIHKKYMYSIALFISADQDKYKEFYSIYLHKLEPHQSELFSSSGKYRGVSGKASQGKLFSELKAIIDLDYKNNIPIFREWLDNVDGYIDGWQDVEALYDAIVTPGDFGIFHSEELENGSTQLTSDFCKTSLTFKSEKDKIEFIRCVEERYCDGEDIDGWCAFQRAMEKDD